MTSNAARLTLLSLAALATLVSSPLGAHERLTIRVAPRLAMAPATLVIDAVAEADAANPERCRSRSTHRTITAAA